jgi:hypothetical protein
VAGTLLCTVCGRRLGRGRGGAIVHAGRGPVAACDLDSDHVAVPDWEAAGEIPCRRCGAPGVGRGGGFAHVEAARDADHAAEPSLP